MRFHVHKNIVPCGIPVGVSFHLGIKILWTSVELLADKVIFWRLLVLITYLKMPLRVISTLPLTSMCSRRLNFKKEF